jgi:hypothetical protein
METNIFEAFQFFFINELLNTYKLIINLKLVLGLSLY